MGALLRVTTELMRLMKLALNGSNAVYNADPPPEMEAPMPAIS